MLILFRPTPKCGLCYTDEVDNKALYEVLESADETFPPGSTAGIDEQTEIAVTSVDGTCRAIRDREGVWTVPGVNSGAGRSQSGGR